MKILKEGEEGFGGLIEYDSGYIPQELNKSMLKESTNQLQIDGDSIFIKCILQKADALNRNGRVYPRAILEREINKYMALVKANSAISEIDHPDTLNISLSNIPHRVVDMWWEGDTVYGKLEIFLTRGYVDMGICSAPGDKIAELLRRGVKIGISSRGLGSVKMVRGKNMVQDDFELVCFDLVASPSTPNAYLFQESMYVKESVEIKGEKTTKNNKLKEKLNNFLTN